MISVLVDFFLEGAKAFLGGGGGLVMYRISMYRTF